MHEVVNLADAVRKITEDSAGNLELWIVLDADRAQLAVQAGEGEDLAIQLHQGVEEVRASVASASRRFPVRCMTCRRLLKKGPYAVVVAAPAGPTIKDGVILAICTRCGTTTAQVRAHATAELKRLWPNSKRVLAD